MKFEQQLLINIEWSSKKKKLINREWTENNTYWSTGKEVITTPIDQQGMKL